MKIAVCDDSKELREEITSLLTERQNGLEIKDFASGEALLNCGEDFDIIFLDISMQSLSGIEAAEQIRERQEKTPFKSIIVFITAFMDYMQSAFDVNAFHYLVKPVDKEKFGLVFDRAAKEVYLRQNLRSIVIKSGGVQKKLYLKDIHYVESSNKKTVFHTKNGVFDSYGKMEELEGKLGDCFYRCHRCFLVNLESISSYGYDEIRVINGDRLLLAKKKYPDFVKTYLRYAKEGGIVNI